MDSRMADGAYPMKIGEQIYKASMLTDKDYADLDMYVKAAFIANGVNAAKLLDSQEEALELKKLTLSQANLVGWLTIERIGIMSTPEGILHLGFQLIRKRHPEVTWKQFTEEAKKDFSSAFQEIALADEVVNHPTLKDKEEDGDSGGVSTGSEKSI